MLEQSNKHFDITHRKLSIESHRSNVRVERVIGTLREAIIKSREEDFEKKVTSSVWKYNNSYHDGLGCTPFEALKDTTGHVSI